MKYLIFELSMPSNNAWNGKWSGEENYYVIGKKFRDKTESPKETYYTYAFGDGWVAGITIKQVSSSEYEKLLKKSKGFSGYDWMVDSIINYGEIKIPSKCVG